MRTYYDIYSLQGGAPVSADEMWAYRYNLLYCMPLNTTGNGDYQYLITIAGPHDTTFSQYAMDAVNDAYARRGVDARAYSVVCVGHFFMDEEG